MLPSSPRRASSSRRTTSGAMGGSHAGASAAENAMGGNVRIGRSSLAERVAIQNLLVPDSSQSTIIQSRELIDVTPGPVTNLSLDNLEDSQTENTLNQPIVVSTAFHAALNSVNTVIKSSDHVFFHVHYEVLDEASDNAFGSTLERNVAHAGVINVGDDSVTLNLILHTLYDWPSGRFSPTLRQLLYAVDRMPHYGLSVQWLIQPTKEIFALLYSMAPRHPLDIYTLAAHHSLHALAVLASSHLLAYAVHTLTNESVVRMGSVYFKNLAQLQMNRISSLRNILGVVPDFAHASCPADPQRAWALAAYDVVKDAKPDLSPNLLSASLMMYARGVQCPRCKKIFEVAISDAVSKWAMVKASRLPSSQIIS